MIERGGKPYLADTHQRELQRLRHERWARESKLKAEKQPTSPILSRRAEHTTQQPSEDQAQQLLQKAPRVHTSFMPILIASLITPVPAMA
jgi:hypothetical protein